VEDDFYNKLEKFNVQAGKRDKILLAHVQRICEAHDTVMRSYYQQIHGSSGADATCGNNSQFFVISCSRKVKTKQSLSKMSKPTALHTENTAQVSE